MRLVRTGGARTFRKLHAKVLQLQILGGDSQLVQPSLLLVQEVSCGSLPSHKQSHQDRNTRVQGSTAAPVVGIRV